MALKNPFASTGQVTAADIVAIDGPGEGTRGELSPKQKLRIGRGLRGLEVPDPHVSLQHAMIEWDGEYYTITDLDTPKGTLVAGVQIPPHQPVRIALGATFTVGTTTFELVDRHLRFRQVAELGSLVSLLVVALAVAAFVFAPRSDADVALLWKEPIRQGERRDRELVPDMAYLRTRGLDPRKFSIRRVIDADKDGVDEVWFRAGNREYVITFEAGGRWIDLGDVPAGCADVRNAGAGLPILECGAVTWAVLDSGRYQALGQDGVVIWGVPKDSWKGPGPPPPDDVKSWRGTMRRESSLAGFLAANGVDQGIHYLICENAIPGVEPVVLMANGQLRRLSSGCRGNLQFAGEGIEAVRAIAFTVAGHRALIDDLEVHLSGGVDGMFRDPSLDSLSKAWSAEPDGMGARWVSFDGQDHFFSPVAPEQPLRGTRVLNPSAPDLPEKSTTTTVVGTGVVKLDPPGCADLEVSTGVWACQMAQGCMPGNTFLEITDVGCSDAPRSVLKMPYSGGRVDARVGGQQIRVTADTIELENRSEVVRTRVSWRIAPEG